MQLMSIGELATALGVAIITLRRWHSAGKLIPAGRTPGGHRRYDLRAVRQQLFPSLSANASRRTLAYARVSSSDQRPQLAVQALRLQQYCKLQGWDAEVITDLGSGMNYHKPGLRKLLSAVLHGEVARLVLVTKDRLLRFGAELVFRICAACGVDVVVLDAAATLSREQQLTEDLVEILTVFSSRLYGSRSRKNMRAISATSMN